MVGWFKPSVNEVKNKWKMAAMKTLHQKQEDAAAGQ